MKEDKVYLKHILDAIQDIKNSIKNINKNLFKTDKDKRDAIVRRIEIIGEAAKNVSTLSKNKYKEVPWKEMAMTRDKVIHHYFGVDFDAVWEICKKDLPILEKQIKEILNKDS